MNLVALTVPGIIVAMALPASAGMTFDVFSDFEDLPDGEMEFEIGMEPNRAFFSGDGFVGTEGIRELYHSGTQAYMVNPDGVSTIQFETNVSLVQFFARTRSRATEPTLIEAFDDAGALVDSLQINAPDAWVEVTFDGDIDRLRITNFDPIQLNAIDDFGYIVVPAPATFALVAAGLCIRRRRRFASV